MAWWHHRAREAAAAGLLAVVLSSAAMPGWAADTPVAVAQKALNSGKPDVALRALNAALAGNGLKGAAIARAYYLRGLAFAKSGNPAAAIADFNNALYLAGLTDTERADAASAKAAAYQAAGVVASSGAAANGAPPSDWSATVPAAAPIASPPVASPRGASPKAAAAQIAGDATTVANWDAEALASKVKSKAMAKGKSAAVALPEKTAADAIVVTTSETGADRAEITEQMPWQAGTPSAPASPALAPAPQAALPAAPAPGPASASENPIGAMLGGLFKFGQPAGNAPAVTATPEPNAAPVTGTWQTASAANTPPAVFQTPMSATSGGIYLQVATKRTLSEADDFAELLTAKQGSLFSGLDLNVVPTVLGNMGTFYAVRLGPVETASLGKTVCDKLRKQAVDCYIAKP